MPGCKARNRPAKRLRQVHKDLTSSLEPTYYTVPPFVFRFLSAGTKNLAPQTQDNASIARSLFHTRDPGTRRDTPLDQGQGMRYRIHTPSLLGREMEIAVQAESGSRKNNHNKHETTYCVVRKPSYMSLPRYMLPCAGCAALILVVSPDLADSRSLCFFRGAQGNQMPSCSK